MSIPPSIGMLLSLVIGIAIGEYDMARRIESRQVEADNNQVKVDNKKGAEISRDTESMKKSNKVASTVESYKEREVKVPRELNDEEIDNLCVNRYMPDGILQSVRDQISEARSRVNNLPPE